MEANSSVEAAPPPAIKPSTSRKFIYGLLVFALVVAAMVHWVVMPIRVSGTSMLPTYEHGSIHLLNKIAYRNTPPRRFDVVAINAPDGDLYLKRIIALPGERIAIYGGRIFVNGRVLKEPLPLRPVPWEISPAVLGKDDYYVIGDNRRTSVLGAIDRKTILGRLIF